MLSSYMDDCICTYSVTCGAHFCWQHVTNMLIQVCVEYVGTATAYRSAKSTSQGGSSAFG